MCCLCVVYVLSMCCLCVVYVLSMCCLCVVYVLSMFCLCLVYVLSMYCLCLVYVLFMSCLCLVYISCLSLVYFLSISCLCLVNVFSIPLYYPKKNLAWKRPISVTLNQAVVSKTLRLFYKILVPWKNQPLPITTSRDNQWAPPPSFLFVKYPCPLRVNGPAFTPPPSS